MIICLTLYGRLVEFTVIFWNRYIFFASLYIQYREISYKQVFTTNCQHWQNLTFWSFFHKIKMFKSIPFSGKSYVQILKFWKKYIFIYTGLFWNDFTASMFFFKVGPYWKWLVFLFFSGLSNFYLDTTILHVKT